jgi:hypothetical protein
MKRINRFLRLATVGTLAIAITITACRRKNKEEAVDPDPDLTTERDLSNADNDINSLLIDVDKAIDDSTKANLREEATYYATINRQNLDTTISGTSYKRKITMTYNGIGDDGQSRSGVVTIFSVGRRTTNNFNSYVTFLGAKVGGRAISGTKTIDQKATGDSNKWQFEIVANGTITTVDGKSITYSSNRTRVRTGISTLGNLTDDSFTITGSWSGTNANGESVFANISTPLQLAYGCRYFREITSGKIDFTNNSKGITRSVDYGSGGCDGKGTFINAKGRVFEFYFKR